MNGPKIFPSSAAAGWARQWFSPRYCAGPLRAALAECFGDHKLGDSKTRLLIPSLNVATGESYVYKTRHHEKLTRDWKIAAVEVALSTSAAPTYFPIHDSTINVAFVDGGL